MTENTLIFIPLVQKTHVTNLHVTSNMINFQLQHISILHFNWPAAERNSNKRTKDIRFRGPARKA